MQKISWPRVSFVQLIPSRRHIFNACVSAVASLLAAFILQAALAQESSFAASLSSHWLEPYIDVRSIQAAR